jgi:hypothetical protein
MTMRGLRFAASTKHAANALKHIELVKLMEADNNAGDA